MAIEFVRFPGMRLVAVAHRGPYWKIGGAFERLAAWTAAAGIPQDVMVGLYYDDPRSTPEEDLHSHAGMQIADEIEIQDPAVEAVSIPPGDCAKLTHLGPYSGLPAAWGEFIGGLSSSGRQPSGPAFEVYLNDCRLVPPEEVQTDLYQVVAPE